MPFPWAAAIPAAAGIIGNLLTNKANRNQAQLSYEEQKGLMRYQNEYNSPVNQMARLRKAGLSPHLVYGGGNVSGNLTGDMPKYNAPEQRYDLGGAAMDSVMALSAYQDIKLKKATEDKVQTDIVGQKIRNSNEAIKNLRDAFELQKAKKLEQSQVDMAQISVDRASVELQNAFKTGELRDEEIETKKLNRQMIAAQIANLDVDRRTKEKLLADMRKGIYPNTSGWIKLAKAIGDAIGLSIEEIKNSWTWVTKPTGKKEKQKNQSWSDKGFHKNPNYKK